jgi:hypothetical protein
MNKIDFEIRKQDKIGKYYYYDIHIIIDDYLYEYSPFNGVVPLAASEYDYTEFDLFNCTCGEAGCAGFHAPIKQEKENNTVTWYLEDKYKEIFGTNKLVFSQKAFEETFQNLTNNVKDLEKNGWHLFLLIDSFFEDDFEQNPPASVEEQLEYFYKVSRYDEEFFKVVKENAPEYFYEKFYECYGDECSIYTCEFPWIIQGIMNDVKLENKGMKFYMAKVAYATQAVCEFMKTGKCDNFEKILHHQYKKFELETKDLLIWTRNSNSLDWNKLYYKKA